MPRIAAIKQDVRNYSADRDYHKENGTKHAEYETEGSFFNVDEGLEAKRYY